MQAIILAAGMGKRLKDLTAENTKCLVKVDGISLIERMLSQLNKLMLTRIIIVVGYKCDGLIQHITGLGIKTPIKYVYNEIYFKTNNIYSLFLARDYLLEDDTILLESDLIFQDGILELLVDNPYPSLALVSKYESWMDGTVVKIDNDNNIIGFLDKKHFKYEEIRDYYKTVNVYKFSKSFSNTHYVPFLEAYCKALGNNEYYEQVLRVIAFLNKPEIKALPLYEKNWYEIDDVQDLDIAESIFISDPEKKYEKILSRYGGYWRYPHLIDFCYLVNPYYPSQRLLDEIKASFEILISNYPSGLKVNNLLAAKYFGVSSNCIIVGNGAAELIKSLVQAIDGTIGMISPSFDEYRNRCFNKQFIEYTPSNSNFSYTSDELIAFYDNKNISSLIVINPDNPSGNFLGYLDLMKLLQWAKRKSIRLIVDESFCDFAESEKPVSLIKQDILNQYSNLVIIKSISKSYGVPGLRIGVLLTSNKELIEYINKDVAIWNINSFGEFFLQIWEKYKNDYDDALICIKNARNRLVFSLSSIDFIRVIPSQANYLMCEITSRFKAKQLAVKLLDEYSIIIKDLSSKHGFDNKQYIRIAVKSDEDNARLISALQRV